MDEIKSLALEMSGLIDDKKGEDIVLLEVKGKCSIADYFIIATGNNDRQVNAIVDHLEDKLAERGIFPKSKEGQRGGRWVILDYFDVVVHVFHKDERYYYNLERLWNDAKSLKLDIDTFQ